VKHLLKLLFPLYILFLFTVALPQENEAIEAETGKIKIEVKMASGIEDRMPTDVDTVFNVSSTRVYCWSAVTGATDSMMIYHVWNFQGRQQARVPIKIVSSYFRAHSFQTLSAEHTGDWTVYIIDSDNNLLGKANFRVEPDSTLVSQ
jgi:Protein of unknown function (DUF2914)